VRKISPQSLRHPPLGRSLKVIVASVVAFGGLVGVMAGSASALSSPTPLTSSDFAGATSSTQWLSPLGTNDACLTAGSNTTQRPIPGCDLSTPDPVGSGVLQLTTNDTSEVGSAFSQVALPTEDGLDINFTTYQYNGTGSDGIAFDLAATDPTDPAPPVTNGSPGGTLGYSSLYTLTGGTVTGLPDAYLGIGLDVFGNFLSKRAGIGSCAGPGNTPESVTARGPGDGLNGYCVLGTTRVSALDHTLDAPAATSRVADPVPVEIAINPSDAAVTAFTSGLLVPAKSWLIAYSPVGVTQTNGSWSSSYSLSGLLPTTLAGPGFSSELANSSDFPTSWINPTTGLPYLLTFGWTGSTGALTEVHDISVLTATTLVSQAPVLSVTNTDNEHGIFLGGNRAIYTVTPTVNDNVGHTDGSEASDVYVTDTFPVGEVPGQPISSDANWTCPAPSGQTITCTYTVSSAIAPGTALTPIEVPVSFASNASGLVNPNAVVSSLDAASGVADDPGVVSPWVAKSTPKVTPTGARVILSAFGLPAAAHGSRITMKYGKLTLCSFVFTAKVSSCTESTLPPGAYTKVTAVLSNGSPYSAQAVKVSPFIVTQPVSLTIHYQNASPALSVGSKAEITFLVKEIRYYHLNKAIITGYTSSTGSAQSNRLLSDARAKAAAKFLVAQLAALHVKGVKVETFGRGASHYAVHPTTSGKNRRTVLAAN
jgi:outer membrane protein OmpA-like peptidoglycan-associated protein